MHRLFKPLSANEVTPLQLRRWRWLLPLGLIVLAVLYEIGPANWINARFGFIFHSIVDVLFFGTVGPILAFLALSFVSRWLEERQTSELQSLLLAQTRQDAQHSRLLNDDAVQILFAASTLIDFLKSGQAELPSETAVQVETMERSLHQAIEQLHDHLLNADAPKDDRQRASLLNPPRFPE